MKGRLFLAIVLVRTYDAEFDGFGVSIGLAYLAEADGDPQGALQLADERMYAAKDGAA